MFVEIEEKLCNCVSKKKSEIDRGETLSSTKDHWLLFLYWYLRSQADLLLRIWAKNGIEWNCVEDVKDQWSSMNLTNPR